MSQSFYNRRCGCRLFGLLHTPWIGGLMVLVAVVLTGFSAKLENNHNRAT